MADGKISNSQINSQIKIWENFAESNKHFKINPDKKWVEKLAQGVLNNENRKGLKFCPCRITLGEKDKDIKLICPCNFRAQKTWEEKGECWCSLFVKKK